MAGCQRRERYIAHEIGHLLGLADLYLEPGSNEFSLPQPASALMAAVEGLKIGGKVAITEDDRNGLFTLVDALLVKKWDPSKPSCPSDYTLDVNSRGGSYGNVFCSPKNVKKVSKPLIFFP